MIDFSPFMESDNIAIRFSNEEQADQFLLELNQQFGKKFLRDTNYWYIDRKNTVYIPRLHSGSAMTHTRYSDAIEKYTVLHYDDLVFDTADMNISADDILALLL